MLSADRLEKCPKICPKVLEPLPQITLCSACLTEVFRDEKESKVSKKLEYDEQPVEVRTRLPRWLHERLEARAVERQRSKAWLVREVVVADLRAEKVQ